MVDKLTMAAIAYEKQWLIDNPQFEERPASLPEFLGPQYLNIEEDVRPAVLALLIELFGTSTNPVRIARYQRAIFTGAIGIGKTTVASIVLTYMAHWILCLKDPQKFFGLMAGSRIAFMQMSTSGDQAKDVVFGDVQARINNSPWFQRKYPPDKRFTTQIRFDKEIWILPGDSSETTFEGYNILGGILDEIDSHKITQTKDYADQGYTTIHGRITSRFQNRGFILLIGQMKSASGFASRMYREMRTDPEAFTSRMTIWESMGWEPWGNHRGFLNADGTRDSFWYDTTRYAMTTQAHAEMLGYPSHIIEIPNIYKRDFINSPSKALRDLAGMPPAVQAPFIHDVNKIDVARLEWKRRYAPVGPFTHELDRFMGDFAEWFVAKDSLKRVIHVDIAYSGEGDALGLAMGHVPELVVIDGEEKPFIAIDLLIRLKAPPGREIQLFEVREIIYRLRDDLGFNIKKVTTDGFESTDFRQQLTRKRISTEIVSVDRTMLPYQDLYDALSQERIALPPYETYYWTNDHELTDVLFKELSQLQETDKGKIDHPPDGSKDLADAVAAVTFTLMGTRRFRTGAKTHESSPGAAPADGSRLQPAIGGGRFQHPAIVTDMIPSAPVPGSFGELVPWTPPRPR